MNFVGGMIGLLLLLGHEEIAIQISKQHGHTISIFLLMLGIIICIYYLRMLVNEYEKKESEKIKQLREVLLFSDTFSNLLNEIIDLKKQVISIEEKNEERYKDVQNHLQNLNKLSDIYDSCQDTAAEIEKLNEKQADLRQLPQHLCKAIDEMKDENANVMVNICESISDMNSQISEGYTSLADEIADNLAEYTDSVNKNLSEFSKLCNDFDKSSNIMIEKMTQMSKEDMKVIKGILGNGN